MSERKAYHFSLGDSSEGPIGYCAVIAAESPESAVEKLNEYLRQISHESPDLLDPFRDAHRDEYLVAYFNPHPVTVDDIDSVDDLEEEESDE